MEVLQESRLDFWIWIIRCQDLDAGRAGQVQAFGFDLVPENAAMMRRGVIRALICQQPRRQGHDAIRAAWQLLLNEGAAQERILMETSICILQNMDEA